ncbi:MopE-related protein [Corallococcus sp. 4LFB]|uniref:MopE-related protein n=1 Tax=Corallococcus sp. 4LFB TaxID=3383249 RepID=UPI003976BE0B
MRLFLLAVLVGVLAGCSKGDGLKSAALKVQVHYEGFRPGCVTLRVTDQSDPSRQVTTDVNVPAGPPPGTLSVAVFRQAGWSNDVKLLATAREQSCDGAQVATAQTDASLAKDGITPVDLSLSATDSDGDGFVRTEDQGTDCNDRDANQKGPTPWYTDADGDNYGNRNLDPLPAACMGPPLSASRTGDCDDTNRSINPGVMESRCDTRDDNRNDATDEGFNLGGACLNDFQCEGGNRCNLMDAGVECFSTVTPTAYFFDEDGDGKAGMDGGVKCGTPPPGTVAEFSDCDESSPFVNAGREEACDRLDNNCVGGVDEGSICGQNDLNWQGSGGIPTDPSWRAIAVGQNLAWLAGSAGTLNSDNLLKVEPNGNLTLSTCTGTWNAAWVSDSGQLFLAGNGGRLASKLPAQPDCTPATTPDSIEPLNGLVGFNAAGATPLTLYGVASNGLIFRWMPPADPVKVDGLFINLRAVHAAEKPETMLAVGANDPPPNPPRARVARFNPADGGWTEEALPAGLPDGYLRGVYVVSANYAYAVGDKGVILERNHGSWRRLLSPALEPDLTDVVAFGQKAIYVTTATGTLQFFDGTKWTIVYSSPNAKNMRVLDATSPTQIGASGDFGVYQFFRWPKP